MSDEFWDAAAPLLAEGVIDEGTIMNSGCVRANGEFVAMPNHKGPGMVVKLPKGRVAEMVDCGEGLPFAPAGRVFSEWVLIADHDENRWRTLMADSIEFVAK